MLRTIDLATARKLVVHEAGLRYSVTIPPIPESVWLGSFFDAVSATVKCGRGEAEKQVDVSSALIGLVEKVAIACEGYAHLDGVIDWQSKIPLTHRKTYGRVLTEVRALENADPPASDGTRAIEIEAIWSGGTSGEMFCYRNLIHHFKTPTPKQRERFRQAFFETRRINGFTRRGAPIFLAPVQPMTAHTLAALYDELIVSVDGYAVCGQPLGTNRLKIIHYMDTFHKVTAARPLFTRTITRGAGGR